MRQIHVVTAFSRQHLKETLIRYYEPMGIIWHPVMFTNETNGLFGRDWIKPLFVENPNRIFDGISDGGYYKKNAFIQSAPIVDGDYYIILDDDDGIEADVFEKIRQMDDDVIFISLKRGYRKPKNVIPRRQYPISTLYAAPQTVALGEISQQQYVVKGKVFKQIHFEENTHWADGQVAVWLKDNFAVRYEPDLYALFNYFEPGRWDKSSMSVSNVQHLAIGVPCTFPTVPTSFFYSFVLMEKPNYTFVHADNGPIDTLRNDIVEKALQVGATKLIMMDVDMIYHPKTITRLLSHKLPVVAALCFRRYPPFDSIVLRISPDGYYSVDDWEDGELLECDATGAGCIMYDMDIFKKMPYPWFRFQKHPETGAGIGEDVGFCQDLKAAGYRIFVDTSVPADHLTTMAVNEKTFRLYQTMKLKQHQDNMSRALGSIDIGKKV